MEKNRNAGIRLFVFLLAAVFIIETLIMFCLLFLMPHIPAAAQIFLDASVLVILIYPLLFKAVLRPLASEIAERKKSEERLEEKVRERIKFMDEAQEATLNILEDLTEAKDKLAQALTVKSRFTSMVSHELRTPLAAIKESISIVSDGVSGSINKEQSEFLTIAKRNVDRLSRLINDILDFQKLEAGVVAFDIQPGSINEIAEEVGKLMLPLAKERGLDLGLKIDPGLPSVMFDRDKIIQVLMNLVNNAVKFTQQGTITISTAKGDGCVLVAVEDTGAGIRKEDMPKLFQQFEQIGRLNRIVPGGTGLGLVISKEIVLRHKGRIWAESEFGRGSKFFFALPVT